MKKLISIFLICLMSASLTGCGSTNTEDTTKKEEQSVKEDKTEDLYKGLTDEESVNKILEKASKQKTIEGKFANQALSDKGATDFVQETGKFQGIIENGGITTVTSLAKFTDSDNTDIYVNVVLDKDKNQITDYFQKSKYNAGYGVYQFNRPGSDFFKYEINKEMLHAMPVSEVNGNNHIFTFVTKYYDKLMVEADENMNLTGLELHCLNQSKYKYTDIKFNTFEQITTGKEMYEKIK